MDEYNWFADLLSTFRSVNDGVKLAIVLGFYGTVLGTVALALARRLRSPRAGEKITPVRGNRYRIGEVGVGRSCS